MLVLLGKAVLALLVGGIIGVAFGCAFHDDSGNIPNRNGTNDKDDDIFDFIMPRDAMNIARGDNPLDPKSQWKSIADPLDLFENNTSSRRNGGK